MFSGVIEVKHWSKMCLVAFKILFEAMQSVFKDFGSKSVCCENALRGPGN